MQGVGRVKNLSRLSKRLLYICKEDDIAEVVKLIRVLQEFRSDYAFYGVISFFRTAYKMMSAVV